VPEEAGDSDYIAVRDMVRRVCDHAARHGQTFALETGQEPADTLLRFIKDTDRANLKINFDPANMILYGTGDPIEAFERLAPHVVSVHAKDGDWPARDKPGSLGSERRLGEGSVGMQRFVAVMKRSGYHGTVNVEREIEDQAQRLADIRHAVTLLRGLIGNAR
jgi:sugar phosphate isomerase/epimerase